MFKHIIFILIFILSISSVSADDYIIDGNKVYIDNSDVYLEAVPHTVWNSDVTVSLTTKSYSGNLNILFGFNTSQVIPKNPRYYDPKIEQDPNGTYNPIGWTDLNKDITVIERDFNGKDRWYLLKDVSFTAGDTRKLRFYMETYETTKYDIIAYPSIYGNDIISAYNNGHIMILDPWTGDPPVGGNVYYDFEEGSGSTIFDLWSGVNGTIYGTTWNSSVPTFGVSGDGGSYGMVFDGSNDWVNTTIENSNLQGSFSISLWFYVDTITGRHFLFTSDQYPNSAPVDGIACEVNTGNYGLEDNLLCAVSTSSGVFSVQSAENSIIADQWYHLVIVWDETTLQMIVDSSNAVEYNRSTSGSGSIYSNSMDLQLGRGHSTTYKYYFDGEMDEIKIYNRSLNITEISNLYDCGSIDCNETDPINIITSYYNGTVSDNFFLSEDINFTVNNTLERTCNITLYDDPAEVTYTEDDFTLCTTGCEYDTFIFNMTHDRPEPINIWSFSGNICHYNPTTYVYLNISCDSGSEYFLIPSDEIPNCDVTSVYRDEEFSVCTTDENISIEIGTNALTYNKRMHITDFKIGRVYDNVTLNLTIDGNISYITDTVHYHDTGIKESYAVCDDGSEDYHNITISSSSPILIRNRLDTDCYTIFYDPIYENASFEYCSSNLTFNEIIQYPEPLYWESYLYCNGTQADFYNGTGYSISHGLNESTVTDFQGQNNLSCYWNITLFDGFNLSEQSYFTIVDTVFPNCTGLDDGLSQSDGDYDLSVSCSDENFYSLNLSCSDGTDNYTTGISSELFNLDLMFSLTDDTVCSYEYCDGHPDDFNCIDGNFTLSLFMVEPVFETLVCPTDTTGNSILFTGLIFIAFLLLMVGIIVNKGIFTLVSGLLFIVLSFSLSACSLMIGALFGFVGLFLVITGSFRQVFF